MLRSAVLLCIVGVVLSFDTALDAHWENFKTGYGKVYDPPAEGFRRAIWESNVAVIREHNLQADMGDYSYYLGINEYADWSNDEYKAFLTNYIQSNISYASATFLAPSNVEAPSEVDWRKEGYVTPVKNQGQCGSCWAFSTTGSLEGQHFKKTKKLVSLSEQNLVDCSRKQGNLGCQGGLMDNGFKYIEANHGIDTEASYPYTGKNGVCHFKPSDVGATVTGFTDITSGDEQALMQAAATVGPISVAIDASGLRFQLYRSGIFNNPRCSSTKLDHGVLVVGYGTEAGKDYWLVKNSWGETWGINGYIKMSRNKHNQCGIATQASYPLV